MRHAFTAALAAAVLLAGVAAAPAQETGQIFGRATDNTGAVLPGVTVTVSSPVLLQAQTAVTTATGTYQFPRLPIGTYAVRFELPGFKTRVYEGIRVEIGFNAQVNAMMEISTVEETITVTGASPVVDTKQTGTATTFSSEALLGVPSARDPWVVLQQVPGIAVDRENIGGSQSGQQSGYISYGNSSGNNVWNMDGVNVTDMAATGASAIYYDFDSFEEIQITTGGTDASQQTGGVGINLVTKSGTDRFKGSGRWYLVDDKFESNNINDELRVQNAQFGNPIQQILDYGIEAGGPIIRGRAWAWGSYGKQDIDIGVLGFAKAGCTPASTSIEDINKCLNPDTTLLDNYNIKGQTQLLRDGRFTWFSNYADKKRNARDASDTRPPETVFVQTGPVWTHKASYQHVFSDRFLMDFQYANVGGGFKLDFPNPGEQFTLQRRLEISGTATAPPNSWSRSYSQSVFVRPQDTVDISGNYFVPGVLGGDHAVRFGYRWRDTPSESSSHIGGYVTARFRGGVASEADLHRDSSTSYGLLSQGLFLQDTYTRGRVTLSLGVRYDIQDDEAKASGVDANPIAPQWLPALSYNGADSGVTYKDWSPRLGMTYDVSGTGKTVAKASWALYYGQMGPGELAGTLNPVTAASIRFPWTDLNGDEFVQANELDYSRILSFSGNYNPDNPSFLGTENSVDPGVKNDRTREFIAGVSHELMPNFGVGVDFIYRKYDQFRWSDRVGFSSANYQPVTRTFACGNSTCDEPSYTVTYYQPTIPIPGVVVLRNQPDRYRDFFGWELTARKRFTNRWMANVSLALNSAKDHWDSPAAYQDPTNIDVLNNAQYAPQSGGSGIDNIFTNARWLFKASGFYATPLWDINLGAFYNARQGYPFPTFVLTPSRANRAGQASVQLDPMGDRRLPTFQNVDLKIEKWIDFAGVGRLALSMDAFNLLNANTILARQRQQTSAAANNVRAIVAPRVLRFGFRFTW